METNIPALRMAAARTPACGRAGAARGGPAALPEGAPPQPIGCMLSFRGWRRRQWWWGGEVLTQPAAAAAAAQEVQGRTVTVNHARQLTPASSAGPAGPAGEGGGAVLGGASGEGGHDGEEGAAME